VTEVGVWWIGEARTDGGLVEAVRRRVSSEYGVPCLPHADPARPDEAFDARRAQHSSSRILEWLSARRPPALSRLVALTDRDLFIPILTFVFGEAQLRGRVAVVSTARLAGTPLIPGAAARVSLRLQKEAVHELGHTYGLLHCHEPRCAMARSASLRDVDGKTPALCAACRSRLGPRDERDAEENGDLR